jgi:putative membrane protein
VIGLTVVHVMLIRHVQAFARDRNSHSGRYFRILNEVPTVLMIAIVIMVIVRPV